MNEGKKFNVFISLPMHGRSVEEIRKRQHDIFNSIAKSGWVLMDTITDENPEDASRLWYLGRAIQLLGDADLVVFSDDWRKAKGCHVEHMACIKYGIAFIDLSDDFYMDHLNTIDI